MEDLPFDGGTKGRTLIAKITLQHLDLIRGKGLSLVEVFAIVGSIASIGLVVGVQILV